MGICNGIGLFLALLKKVILPRMHLWTQNLLGTNELGSGNGH